MIRKLWFETLTSTITFVYCFPIIWERPVYNYTTTKVDRKLQEACIHYNKDCKNNDQDRAEIKIAIFFSYQRFQKGIPKLLESNYFKTRQKKIQC